MRNCFFFALLVLPALYLVAPTLADPIGAGVAAAAAASAVLKCGVGCNYSEFRQRCVCHGWSKTDFFLWSKTDISSNKVKELNGLFRRRKEGRRKKAQEAKTEDTAEAEKSVSE